MSDGTANTSGRGSTLTVEKMRSMMAMFPPPAGLFDRLNGPGFDLCGMKVYHAPPPAPVFQLSKDVMVSDKFRAEFNAWAIERFGFQEDIFRDRAFIFQGEFGSGIVMNLKMAVMIRDLGA